jgi:hypothetical protein
MPNQPDEYEGYSPAAANTDTENVHGTVGPAPGSPGTITKSQSATNAETEGTSVAGIGGAQPGGSVTDIMPWSGAGQAGSETGQAPMSDYAVKPGTEGQYGYPLGQPDTGEVYGGPKGTAAVTSASPYPWLPSSTLMTGTLDTQVSGGSALVSGLGAAPAYRAPSAGIAASVKDTTLTDILGNQITAMPLTSSAYGAVQIDTGYIGAPAAPASLSTQVDTFATTTVSPVYASKQGIVPSTLVVQDTTSAQTLVLNTDYTVTTALNGPKTSLYITLIHVSKWTTGDAITMTYQYGSPQYYDSNLPPTQSFTVTDTLWLNQDGDQLQQWGVTTAASALVVVDVTQGNVTLVYNTDYTVTKLTQPFTPGSTYTETPPISYQINWLPTSTVAKLGDVLTVTYAYASSVPSAPAMGAGVSHTQTGISFTVTPVALASAGVITPAASLVVVNTTAGARLGLVQVLNVDYTITVSGSGSTLAYSIARLAGSTHSNSGDTVSVTYSTGNAGYFTSGAVQPVNGGVYVPWTPPVGTTQVDYYLIQASDGGTMFVPASGQPALYGQPSPGGGATSGQPVYQSDTFTTSFSNTVPVVTTKSGVITPPEQLIVRDLTSTESDPLQPTGTVLELGYDYTVTTIGTGPWKTYSILRVANSVNSAQNDTITVSYWYDQMGAVPLTSVGDTVIAAASVATLAHNDIATAPSQLIVLDTTTSKMLAYGLDFTVSSSGIGPAQAVTITLITTGPAGSGATDHLTVYYQYGIALGAVFKQGMPPNAPVIYTPAGTIRPGGVGGYQFQVAAGNRAGLGPFSGLSDYASPLNYAAPQPGFQGTTGSGPPSINPANSINPIYKPDGTVKAGTGLGV